MISVFVIFCLMLIIFGVFFHFSRPKTIKPIAYKTKDVLKLMEYKNLNLHHPTPNDEDKNYNMFKTPKDAQDWFFDRYPNLKIDHDLKMKWDNIISQLHSFLKNKENFHHNFISLIILSSKMNK